jgi:hypothetical protein
LAIIDTHYFHIDATLPLRRHAITPGRLPFSPCRHARHAMIATLLRCRASLILTLAFHFHYAFDYIEYAIIDSASFSAFKDGHWLRR